MTCSLKVKNTPSEQSWGGRLWLLWLRREKPHHRMMNSVV